MGAAYAAALGLLAFVASGWLGLWPGEVPVWTRPRLPAAPSEGGPRLWSIDPPSVLPDDIVIFGTFDLGLWVLLLGGLASAAVAAVVVERGAPRRFDPFALAGAVATLTGIVFASRAAWTMAYLYVAGTEVPRALDDAIRLLLAGAGLSAVGLARVLVARRRRDGATLALCALTTALATAFICERLLVRPPWAQPAPVRDGFEPATVAPLLSTGEVRSLGPWPDEVAEVLEVSATGEVVHVGQLPGLGPPEVWPRRELGERLAALAGRMATAPLLEGSAVLVPDEAVWLRPDGRTPARALLAVQDAIAAAGIWKVGLLYRVEDVAPEASLMLYLPKRDPAGAAAGGWSPPDLTLRRAASGALEVTSEGRPVDWASDARALSPEVQVLVEAEVPAALLLDVLRRTGGEVLGPLQVAPPR